jgi:hypothetical protein
MTTWEMWYRAGAGCPWVLAGRVATLLLAQTWTRTQAGETRITMGLVVA